ncbi:hypothetical protein ACF0H5_000082 [Mactra antiquata]
MWKDDLGCFREKRVPVFYSSSNINPSDLTRESCIQSCSDRSNDYALVSKGTVCFCSNNDPNVELTMESGQCNMPCTGDPSQNCGDVQHVYAFEVKPTVTGTVSVSPDRVATGEDVALVTAVEPTGVTYHERISYNNGEEFTDWAVNSSNLSPWNWPIAGIHQVISEVQDDESLFESSFSAESVEVISPVYNLTLDCPSSAVTFDLVQIPMSLARGTGFTVDIQHKYGTDPFTLDATIDAADARERVLGNAVVPALNPSVLATNGLVVHNAKPAAFDGYLAGIEYYGVNSGSLDVHIYRPTCANPTDEYCDLTHDCKPPTDCVATCDAQGYCSSKQDCCSGPTPQSTTLLTGATYSKNMTVTVSVSPGHGYHNLIGDNIEILKGDVIAHDATGILMLGSKSSIFSMWSDYYCDGFNGQATFTDANCNAISEFHMIGGVYVEDSSILHDMTFSVPGNVTVQATASNKEITNTITDSCMISLVEGVNASIITIGEYIAKDEPTDFIVEPHTGYPTTTLWDFGNGFQHSQVSPGLYQYAYPAIGTYNLTANISNAASFKFNFTTVCVQEKINDFSLLTSGGVEVNVLETINITMSSGTNFSCDFKITDSNGVVDQYTVSESLSIPYTFPVASLYTIAVNCSNNINHVSDVKTVTAVERITNPALTPQGAIVNSYFKFVLTWATGSGVQINHFTVDGVAIVMEIDHVNKIAKSKNSYQRTTTGAIAVTYEISNSLSTITEPSGIFVIEVAITNADIVCQFPSRLNPVNSDNLVVLPMGGSTYCTATMTDGSSVQVMGDWGDGLPTIYAGTSGEPWSTTSGSIPFPVDHTYGVPGTFDMTFSVSNNYSGISEAWTVMVMQGVTGISLHAYNDTVRFDPPAVMMFYFDNIPNPLPNNVYLEVHWGDGTTDTMENIDLTANLTHYYQDEDGDLTLNYNLWNLYDSQSGSLPVYIVTPIENMTCYVEPKAGLPDQPLDLVFGAYRAPPKGVLQLTFDCDTLVAGTEAPILRMNDSPYGLDKYECPPYGSTGTYTMAVEARSRLETKTCTHTFKVLNGVTNAFTVSSNAPIDFDNIGNCDLTINVNYGGTPFPDEAEIFVDFGDSVGYTTVALTSTTTSIQYSYGQTGHYTSTLIIRNDASTESWTFNTGCYKRFGNVQFTPKREPLKPLISPDLDGYGVSKDNFRTDENLKLYTSIISGTFLYWQITAVKSDLSNIITCNSTSEEIITLQIDQPGAYTISIAAVNPIDTSQNASQNVMIFSPARGILVSEFETTPAGENKIFQVDLESYGTDMCVAVYSGDPSDSLVYTYGTDTTCADIFTYLSTEFPETQNASYTSLDVSQPFNLTYSYGRISTYTMRLIAWNEFTLARGNFSFAISGLNCSTPLVYILDCHPNATNPIVRHRSRRNMIKAVSDMRCPETLNNNKLWRVFRVDETTGDDMEEVNIDGLSTRINAEFAIEPNFLPYGFYRCEITVTMATDKETDAAFYTSLYTYIRISKSPLKVQLDLYRTSLDSVAISEQVTLDPATYSVDPDEDFANFDFFEMECRCVTDGESFTTDEIDVFTGGPPLGHTDIGVYSTEFTIYTELFSHYDKVDDFKIDLSVSCAIGVTNTTSLTSTFLTKNRPPYNGNCSVSPSSGVAGQTFFSMECWGFIDDDPDDEVQDYVIKCNSKGTKWIAFGEGEIPSWNMMLPPGDPNNGNILKCFVIVKDDKGSYGTYDFPDVEVKPMSVSDFTKMLQAAVDSDQDFFQRVQASANFDTTRNVANVLSGFFEEFNENAENSAYTMIQTASSMISTGFGDYNVPRNNAFVSDRNETLEELYEKDRANIAEIQEQLLNTFKKCTKNSISEIIGLAEPLLRMSDSVISTTLKAQENVLELLEGAESDIQRQNDDVSVEVATELQQRTSGTCANIQQSANILTVSPTTLDIDAQEDNVPYFDTSKISDVDPIGFYESDEDAKKAGKKNLHKRDETAFIPKLVARCARLMDKYTTLLSKKTVSSQTLEMKSRNSEMMIFNAKSGDITGKECKIGTGSFTMPSFSDDPDENFIVVAQITSSPKGPWDAQTLINRHSREFSIKVRDRQGKTKKTDNIVLQIKIPQDINSHKADIETIIETEPFIKDGDFLSYQAVPIPQPRSAVRVTYRPGIIDYSKQYVVIVSLKHHPYINENGKWENVIKVSMIPSNTMYTNKTKDDNGYDPYSVFVDSKTIGDNTGVLLFGTRELRPNELNHYVSMDNLPPTTEELKKWKDDRRMTMNCTMLAEVYTCGASSDYGTAVSSAGLRPLPSSSKNEVICETTHLTTFGGGWAVAPNTIDWNFIFSNADFLKNPTLYVTEIVIAVAYIIAMIWARRKDRQDVEKLGLAPLPCNDKQDKYYYEIMVSTGMRRGAGTDSKVHFVLSGEEEETEVRTFEDKKRKIFDRGNTDGFLMSVPYSLGALMYLRIWHDNSGKGRMASWYLNHVIVRDVQTEKKYYFIANRWFAVEEDDGQVDRVIPVAGKEQMTQFAHLFSEKATKNLSDGHLWFSVVARPPQSRFTRCQRVSCCLCLLYSSMLANAMFYGTETADSNAFTFGPFALTSKQIFIGIVCNIIVFPVNFLLIHLFRRSRPRKLRPSRLEEAIKTNTERSTSMADVNPRVKSSLDHERPGSSFLIDAKRSASAMSRPETSMSSANVDSKKKKKKKCELPWWFTIIAWILLWLVVLTSAAFVTFYGISFQDMKCKKWITSMLISFFTSVFLTQPIKVFLFAIIFSLIIKNPGSDEDEDDDEEAPKNIECDEEYLHEEDEFAMIAPRKPMHKPKPLDTKALETARKQRLKEIQMWAVIREILFYAFFLWILLVISYRSVNNNSYTYKHNMEKVFIMTNDTNKSFFKIKNTPDFWAWAQSGMLRGLRAGPYYNNFPPFYMRGYINDKVSRLMGPAVLRQVRIRPDTCTLPAYIDGIIEECNGLHGVSLEQEGDFGPGWVPLSGNNSREEYKYRTASELDGYPYWGESAMYGGGGYIVNLADDYFTMISHLQQLEREGWVDKYTRAVFLEFTVYNPSINLFSISTLVSEFRPSGGVFPTFRFEPCNLLPYMNSGLLLQIACEIIYFAFTVFFVFTMFRNLYKQKSEYFYQFWNLVDLGICAMSVTAIVIYFYRLVCINELTEYFHETAGDGYIKFQYVGYWSEIFNYIIGFLVFFATLKFLKLLRFNRKISLLSDTLRNSSKDLINFSLIFNVTFLAFIQVFYLVYMSHLDTFKTFLGSCEAGIVMMMGKFDIYNMLAVNQWMTQIFIFLFVVTITFIVVNMLLSILNDTFTAVRNDKNKQKNDYEIVEFMMGRFKMWTGIGRSNPTISPAELEKQRKAKSIEEQVDQLPDQIDRFLASISNMYIGDARFDSFLQKGIAKKMAMKAKAHDHDPAEFHPAPAPRVPGSQRLSHGLSRGMTDVQTD